MKKNITNKFKWIPMDKRVDNLGLPLPPRNPETKKPLLWIAIDPQDDLVSDVYLVNETGATLDSVIASTGGFESFDDVYGISGNDVEYKDIENGNAIKVDEYHVRSDSDSVLQISFKIKIQENQIELKSSTAKGGFKEEVLLWS